MLLEKVAEKDEIVWRLLGVFADLEVPASGPCIVQWKSQPVGQRSSSRGGGEDLSSAQRDGSQRRRPKHPNLLGSSVVVLVRVVSWVVVAVV